MPLRAVSRVVAVPRSTLRHAFERERVCLREPEQMSRTLIQGTPPYGYVRIDGQLVEDPREHHIVQRVLKLWDAGTGFQAIADLFNHQRVRPRSANVWKYSTIQSIVRRHRRIS